MLLLNSQKNIIFDSTLAPEIQWDSRVKRYRFTDTKRFVSQTAVLHLQRQHIDAIRRDIADIGELLISRRINLAEWQRRTREQLKYLHLGQMLLARGGHNFVTNNDYLQVARTLKSEYKYLQKFAIDVNRGYSLGSTNQKIFMTENRFRDRLSKYADHSRVSFEYGVLQNHQDMGYRFERRFLGIAKHCNGCLVEAERGVQPIGVLRRIGTCECGGRCRCRMEFYKNI